MSSMTLVHLSASLEPPVHRLPPDLLAATFKLALDSANLTDDLMPEHLSRVCRRWYDTAVSYGVLWTTIKLSYATECTLKCNSLVPYTRRRLERSRGALLDISVDYWVNQWKTGYLQLFLECIGVEGEVMQRWASITVTTSYHDSPNPLLDLLRYPTPELRMAKFRCWQDADYDTSGLLPSIPRLVSMDIGDEDPQARGSAFVWPPRVLETVTRLQVSAWDNASIWKKLRPFTSIVFLHLHVRHGRSRAPEGDARPVTFHCLKDIRTNAVLSVKDIFKRISAPSLVCLRLELEDHKVETTKQILASFEPAVIAKIRHLEIRALHCPSRDDFERFMRRFGNVRELHLDQTGVYVFTHDWGWCLTLAHYYDALEDPSLFPLLEHCVVDQKVRGDLVALRKGNVVDTGVHR